MTMFQFIPYLWISIALTIMMFIVIVSTWKSRFLWRVPYFQYTLILATIWIVAQALEIAAVELPTKMFWANLQYISIPALPVTYFFLTLQYTRYERWLKQRWLLPVLLIIPVITNILLWTNDLHGLMRQNIHLIEQGNLTTIGKTYGPFFWLYSVYSFGLTLVTLSILARELVGAAPLYREQVISFSAGLLLPVLSTALQVTGLNPFPIDMTPAVIGLSLLAIVWGILRGRLFDVVPIAHSIIIQKMRTGMIIFDNGGQVLNINPAARQLFGVSPEQEIGFPIETILERYSDLRELYRERKSGMIEVCTENENEKNYQNGPGSENGKTHENEKKCYEVTLQQLTDYGYKPIGGILQAYDITARKLAEARMEYAASHDDLTGLLNRTYFQSLFAEQLAHAGKHGAAFAVAYLDLDDYKQINDTFGHGGGDTYLRKVAAMLKGALRESDIVARFGGDEFAILLPSVGKDEQLELIAAKILKAFAEGISFYGTTKPVKGSLGFSMYPRDGDSMDVLLMKADRAMYQVKESGKNGYRIYQEY